MRLLDRPENKPPEYLPGMVLLGVTIFLEAEDQPENGQLGVAYVICNRARLWSKELHDVILQPMQFSCWNDDYRRKAIERIGGLTNGHWEQMYRTGCAAYWRFLADPTHGAVYYLNPMLTRRIRPSHDLPEWWDVDTDPASEVVISSHVFRNKRA